MPSYIDSHTVINEIELIAGGILKPLNQVSDCNLKPALGSSNTVKK